MFYLILILVSIGGSPIGVVNKKQKKVTKIGKGFDSLGVCDTTIARHGKVKDKGFHWLLFIYEHLAQLVERKPCYNMEEGINKKNL